MQYRYKKLLGLLDKESISQEDVQTALDCSQEEANMLYNDLERMEAVKSGKIVSAENFRKCALHRMVYDARSIMAYNLHQIIENVLVDDDRFVEIVRDNIDKRFTTQLSNNSKKYYLQEIFEDDTNSYIIEALASKFLLDMYKESKGLFLDLYWSNKLNDML